jgi:hypothetical protein
MAGLEAGVAAGFGAPSTVGGTGASTRAVLAGTREIAADEAPTIGKASEYIDLKKGRSVANYATNVTRAEFEANLLDNGWAKSISKDGVASLFTKDGARYTIRDVS